jgi:hypothetical protein
MWSRKDPLIISFVDFLFVLKNKTYFSKKMPNFCENASELEKSDTFAIDHAMRAIMKAKYVKLLT